LVNNLKAFNPNCSKKEASFAIDFCGGHLGKVKENIPKTIAPMAPIIN
jgi:hypothetical protein